MPQAWLEPGIVLQIQSQIRRHEVPDAHPLKSLENENSKLKRLLADTMFDNVVLKDFLGKN